MPPFAVHDPCWWLTALGVFLILHLMAYAAWPWFTRLFPGRQDRGAGLAMAGGIFIYILAAQLWWRTGLFEIRFVWSVLLLACVGLSGHLLFFKRTPPGFGTRARMRKSFLQGWVIFSLLFWYWAGIRASDPGVTHTEQPMDVMWMQAAATSHEPPIRDAWFGGEPASYYSDGHQALAMLGVLLGLPIAESVNLTQIIWFALTGTLAFQAGKSLYALSGKKGGNFAGGLSLFFGLFVSTPAGFRSVFEPGASPWWWKASRVLFDGDTELITEFPFFSFWLGDNHAHLIGLPFFLLALLSAVALYRTKKIAFSSALLPILLIFWSWRINPWQVPTVLAFPLIAVLIRKQKITSDEIRNLALALLPGLLFLYPIKTGGPELALEINPSHHTNVIEALQVFGFFVPGFLLSLFFKPHRFWIVLSALILGMFFCVEVIFLKDLFQNRMNTVFKVYYQIWILAGILSALGWAVLLQKKGTARRLGSFGLLGVLLPGLAYAGKLSLEARARPDRSLHAWSRYSASNQSALYTATKLIQPGDRIAEAPGESYDPYSSKFGTWTAGSTLIGWTGHEQQWRPGVPHPDVAAIYEAQSEEELLQVVRGFQVQWIALGARERDRFEFHPDWESWLDKRASRVVDLPEQCLYRVR